MASKTPQKRVLFARLSKYLGVVLLVVSVFTVLALTAVAKTAYAVSNPTVNFQARLMSSAGAIVPDGSYNVEFKLYSASSGGTALWTEDWLNSGSQGISVANGYLTASLGSINPFANATTAIPWGSSLWLTMNIGGTTTGSPSWDGEMSPRLSLTSVPSALALTSSNDATHVSTLGFVQPTASQSLLLPVGPNTTNYVCYQGDVAGCGFAATTGGSGYIQNTVSVQAANFYVQAGSSGSVAGVLRANASGTGDILDLKSGGGTNVATFGSTGAILLENSANSTTALQVQQASAGTVVLNVDTTNKRVGIDNAAPSYALDVTGDINSTTAVRIAGTSVCDTTGTTGCIAKSGSGYYIHNQTTIQTGANFYIQGASSTVGGVIEANGADILDLQNSSAANVVSFGSTGVITVIGAQAADITTANSGSGVANGITIKPGTSGGAASAGGTVTVQAGVGAGTGAGGLMTIQGGTSGSGAAAIGGNVQIQGGTATGTGVSNGGNIILQGGSASGTGTVGQIQINGGLLYATVAYSSGSSTTITQSAVDSNSTILATATAGSLTFTVPSPTVGTAGRILLISNVGSNSFVLAGSGTSFSLNVGSTATLMWNGSAWTNAGVDASTLQTVYNNSTGGTTPQIKLSAAESDINIQNADGALGGGHNFISLRDSNSGGLGNVVFGFGVNGNFFEQPVATHDSATAFTVETSTTNSSHVLFNIDTSTPAVTVGAGVGTAATSTVNIATSTTGAGTINIGSATSGSAAAGTTVLIQGGTSTTAAVLIQAQTAGLIGIGTQNAANTIQVGSITLNSGTQAINIGTNVTAGGTTNITIGTSSSASGFTTVQAKGALSLSGGAASTWQLTSGTLTIQSVGSVSLSGASVTVAGTATSSFSTTGGNLSITDSDNTAGKSLTIDATGATNGTLNLGNSTPTTNIDSGSSNTIRAVNIANSASITSAAQTVIIGTAANTGNSSIQLNGGTSASASVTINAGTQTATTTIGNSAAGAIGIQSASGVSINASINGTVNINTGTSTGAVNIGNGAAGAIAVQTSTSLTLTSGLNGIPMFINVTNATFRESAIGYQVNGTLQGEIGIAGTATHIVNQSAVNDLALKSLAGNVWLAAGSGQASVEISATDGSEILQSTSAAALNVQTSGGTAVFQVNTSAQDIILGGGTTDPTVVAGAIYYNSNTGTFRCAQSSTWQECLGMPTPNTARTFYSAYSGGTTASTGQYAMPSAIFSANGDTLTTTSSTITSVATTSTTPAMAQFASGGAINNQADIFGTLEYNTSAAPLIYQSYVKTVTTTNSRTWIGLSDQTVGTMEASATPTGNYAAFRYDTGAGDTSYKCVTSTGSSRLINSSGITTLGAHKFEVDLIAGTSAVFKIDGAIVCTNSSFVAATATNVRFMDTITTLTNAAANFDAAWVYVQSAF